MTLDNSRTKIIATIGPASSDKETLRKMFIHGVDVCRMNFSHGNYEVHAKVMKIIRELNKEMGIDVALLADLQGPKLRIGEVENNKISAHKQATGKYVKRAWVKRGLSHQQLYKTYQFMLKI